MTLNARFFGGLLKAGKYQGTHAELANGTLSTSPVLPAPIRIWIAQENVSKPLMATKVFAGENPGYTLGLGGFTEAFEVIHALIRGERMQMSVRYKNEPLDYVISFAQKMPENEAGALLTCIDKLLERMAK